MNPDLTEQLAQALGLASDADMEGLIAKLRAGDAVDPLLLRRTCLALLDNLQVARDASVTSNQRLQIALESSNLAMWDWDIPGEQAFVDRTFGRMIGRSDHDKVWNVADLAQLVHEDDREPFSAAARAAMRGDVAMFQVSYRLRHADGRWVWLESHGSVTARSADGRATRMTGTHADITDRKQMERALSNVLRTMQTLIENMPLPVVLRDVDRRVTLVNAAWEEMIGIPRHEVVGNLLSSVPKQPPIPGHRETDDQVIATRKPMRYETVVRARDGTVFNVIVAKTPLLAEDGSLTGLASVVTDISDHKRATAILERARLSAEEAVRAKSRFLANMSHELRTPLNGVVGMTSLLENTALDPKQRRFVRTLRSSAEALITLINDVLDLSKAEAGKLELTAAPFDLRREIEQVVGLFSGRAHDKGIEIAAHLAREVPASMKGDPVRLRQVLGNLINNAIKFTDAGAVLLAVSPAPGADGAQWLEFTVTDTGMGVAPEEQKRIFDAFEQADDSVTRKFGGTGLGLSISRQIVDLMGGSMSVVSEPGQGSRFSFVVPAGVPLAVSPPPVPAADSAFLIVGLHPVIRRAACETVAAECAQVLTVDSASQVAEAMNGLNPQISRIRVLLDDIAGIEPAVKAMRAAAGTRQLEVIALLPPDADVAPLPGATRTLFKPLCTPDLLAPHTAHEAVQSMGVGALPARGSRGRALVVEDNLVNQEMARAMLDMMGFEVSTAANGLEGVRAAGADPDLAIVLMDCQMPVMDGLSAVRAIRAAEPAGKRIPIVALTGNAMPGDREACLAAGMDDYLAKPFSLKALRNILDKWAGGARHTQPANEQVASN